MPAPSFPIGPGPGPTACPIELHNSVYYLSLFERLFPAQYLDPIKAAGAGGGYELFQAFAVSGEWASRGAIKLECDNLITFAEGGFVANVIVEFFRTVATAGEVIVLAGTLVKCSRSGRLFITTTDATFTVADLGPHSVGAFAVLPGYEWNVEGPRTTLAGEVLAGEIDTIFQIQTRVSALDAAFVFDPAMQVRQVSSAKDGADAALDALGADRGIARAPGEDDDAYRTRMRTLVDVVTISAIRRAVSAVLDAAGIYWRVIETFDIAFLTAWDAPTSLFPTVPEYDPTTFVWDDPAPSPPFRGRWLGPQHIRAAVILVIENLPVVIDMGMAYDDPAVTPEDHESRIGVGAYTAYDVPNFFASVQGAYDGRDTAKESVYAASFDVINAVRAAGVNVSLELAEE